MTRTKDAEPKGDSREGPAKEEGLDVDPKIDVAGADADGGGKKDMAVVSTMHLFVCMRRGYLRE